MKLSSETVRILKHFSNLNRGIEFKAGNNLATISASQTILAEAVLEDSFPEDFCVEDLSQFLSVNSLFAGGAELEFDESNVVFKNEKSTIKYRKTAKEMIIVPPYKGGDLDMADTPKINLTAKDFEWIQKTAAVLASPHIAFESDGDGIYVVTYDMTCDSAHVNKIRISDGDGTEYKVVFSTANLNILSGDYEVVLSVNGLGHFKNLSTNIQYWIAAEVRNS